MPKVEDGTTAGPSPDGNKRTEIYFAGCSKARNGKPCTGCFNTLLWYDYHADIVSPQTLAFKIINYSSNKYVSICGGEPTDQLSDLIELCEILKSHGYHILVYTYHLFHCLYGFPEYEPLFNTIDILIDGTYDFKKRIYKEDASDGFYSSIGSSNQKIIDLSEYTTGYPKYYSIVADRLNGITFSDSGHIVFQEKGDMYAIHA
jgi:organic radical activating enzyme